MKRIRVVHVANHDLGLKSHLGNYMRFQQRMGYDVSAIASPGTWLTHDTTILDDIPVKLIPLKPRISPFGDLNSLLKLLGYFQKQQFDIVHTHTIKPGLLGRMAAQLVGIPIIIHTFHGLNIYDGMPRMQFHLFRWIETLGCACGHSVLSQSRDDINTAIKQRICAARKLHYLGNGIDLDRFTPDIIDPSRVVTLRSDLGISANQKVVGYIGRIEREKGVCEFIEAINILHHQGVQAKYVFIGAQQVEKQTTISPEVLLRRCEVKDDLIFLGYRTDLPLLLAMLDVVTLPSYHEGIPRCLMESAAMGRPVVSTRIRGIQETVLDGKTGILVPPRNAEALAKGLMDILSNSGLRQEMGRRARQHAIHHFDEQLFFKRSEEEYRRLIKVRLNVDAGLIPTVP